MLSAKLALDPVTAQTLSTSLHLVEIKQVLFFHVGASGMSALSYDLGFIKPSLLQFDVPCTKVHLEMPLVWNTVIFMYVSAHHQFRTNYPLK